VSPVSPRGLLKQVSYVLRSVTAETHHRPMCVNTFDTVAAIDADNPRLLGFSSAGLCSYFGELILLYRHIWSRDSSVGVVTGYGLNGPAVGVDSWERNEIFLFTAASRPAPEFTRLLIR
jgi:hypothetical protein